jgi:hypothetical protein
MPFNEDKYLQDLLGPKVNQNNEWEKLQLQKKLEEMDAEFMASQAPVPSPVTPTKKPSVKPAVNPTSVTPPPVSDIPDTDRDVSSAVSQYIQSRLSGNEDLKEAQKLASQRQFYAGLGESFDKIGSSIAGVKSDPTQYRNIAAQSDSQVKNIMQEKQARAQDQDAQAKELAIANQTELQDPNSRKSQVLQKTIKQLYPGMFKDEDISKVSAADMDLLYKPLALKEQIESRREVAQLRNSIAKESRDNQFLSKYQQRAEGHPLVKANDERLQAVNTIENMVNEAVNKGGQSVAALGPLSAKALGERGVLTEQDVKRYTQNPQLVKGMLGTYQRWVNGKLRREDGENIKSLMNIMKQEAIKARNEAYDRVAAQYAEATDIGMDEARKAINPYGYDLEQKAKQTSSLPPANVNKSSIEEEMRRRGIK